MWLTGNSPKCKEWSCRAASADWYGVLSCLSVDNVISLPKNTSSRNPQGCVLSPLLFVIFIIDLRQHLLSGVLVLWLQDKKDRMLSFRRHCETGCDKMMKRHNFISAFRERIGATVHERCVHSTRTIRLVTEYGMSDGTHQYQQQAT